MKVNPIRYPFDITYTPMYEFIYLISAWSDWITTVGVYGIDGLFIGVCLHLSGQFEIIASRMEDLTADGKFFNYFFHRFNGVAMVMKCET